MKTIKELMKKETVFCVSFLLALVSSLIVRPDRAYLAYPDYRTLALLFCLMVIVAGFQSLGVFVLLGQFLLKRAGSLRNLPIIMVLLCFFSSMVITNDVTLITFVPFTLLVYQMIRREEQVLKLVVLETIAANLGSMATPIGNPQNLYLYSISGITMKEFAWAVWPYAILALVMLLAVLAFGKDEPLSGGIMEEQKKERGETSVDPASPLSGAAFSVPFGGIPGAFLWAGADRGGGGDFSDEPEAFWKGGLLPPADVSLLFRIHRECKADPGNQRLSHLPGRRKGAVCRDTGQPGDQQCAGSHPFVRVYGGLSGAADSGKSGRSGNTDRFSGQPDLL